MDQASSFLRSVFADGCFRTDDIDDLAYGSAFLGGGGGGDPYVGSLLLRFAMRETVAIPLVDLAEIEDEAAVSLTALIGSPMVMVEKLPGLAEIRRSLEFLDATTGRRSQLTLSGEAGGINGLMHLVAAAELGLPAIDGDTAGRAIPEVQMTSLAIHGHVPPYVTIADEHGNAALVSATTSYASEKMLRSLTIVMGSAAILSSGFTAAPVLRAYAIGGTTSIATALGRAVKRARSAKQDPVEALLRSLGTMPHYNKSGVLFRGKVVDVQRRTEGGWNKGKVRLAEIGGSGTMTIDFQNEYLIAWHDGRYCASMPDLISIVNSETADIILAEALRYGQRVTVIGASVPDIIRGPMAIRAMGPRVFGYEVDYVPIERLGLVS